MIIEIELLSNLHKNLCCWGSFTAEKHVTQTWKFQETPYGKDMYFFDF